MLAPRAKAEALARRAERFAPWREELAASAAPSQSPKRKRRRKKGEGAEERRARLLREGVVRGTCQTVEKEYLRLTAAPDPALVRPLPVLRRALELVKRRWGAGDAGYEWACSQLKSIRQDMTVQHVREAFTVDVYETHARVALEEGDLDEFAQCQSSLRAVYREGLPARNANEFAAYRVILEAVRKGKADLGSVALLKELGRGARADPAVRHALAVQAAVLSSDYGSFFRLYVAAPNMSGYLMDHAVGRFRRLGFEAMCAAYRPTVPVALVARVLAFGRPASALPFLREAGAVLVDGTAGRNTELDARQTHLVLVRGAAAAAAAAAPVRKRGAPADGLTPAQARQLRQLRGMVEAGLLSDAAAGQALRQIARLERRAGGKAKRRNGGEREDEEAKKKKSKKKKKKKRKAEGRM